MKRIFLTLTSTLLIGLSLTFAQQQSDTTERSRQQYNREQQDMNQQDRTQQRDESWQQDQSQQQDQSWQQDQSRQQDHSWQQDQSGQQGRYGQNSDAYANEGMVIVNQEDLPESVREKLKDDKYAGWENGTVYHNTNTGEYVIAPRAYRFDEQGNEIEPDNTASYDNSYRNQNGVQNRSKYGDQNSTGRDSTDMQSNDRRSSDMYHQPSDTYRKDDSNDNGNSSSEYRSGQQDRSNDADATSGQRQYGQEKNSQYDRTQSTDDNQQTQSSNGSVEDQ